MLRRHAMTHVGCFAGDLRHMKRAGAFGQERSVMSTAEADNHAAWPRRDRYHRAGTRDASRQPTAT